MAELNLYWLDEQDIINQVQDEYDESIQFTQLKRDLFKRRDSLYLWIADTDTKLYVRLIYSVVDTLLALEMGDKRSVIFAWRKFWMDEYAENVNNCAKYDYEQMWCEKKKYFARKHKYLKWPWIEVMDWWDDVLDVPTYKVISPMVWCPDWFGWVNNWPRYHWFEYQATRREVENNDKRANTDQVLSANQLDTLKREEQERTYNNRELSTLQVKSTDIIDLYYHYTIFKWIKYLTILANERTTLLYVEKVPAITDIEKKDPSKIEFPVIVRYRRPLENDPFGISVPDLLEDKQTMMQLFLNLNKIKAEHEALWDMFLFDPDKVDVESLKIPTLWPKYIPVNWLAWLSQTPMWPVAKQQISPDSYNMPNILKQEATLGIWMDERTLWVWWWTFITATENQRVQANANLRLMLGIKWDNIAEKQFRWLRYRYYLNNFWDNKEKTFRLNDWLGSVYYAVKKKDFMWLTDIDIEITSQTDVDEQKAKERAWYTAVASLLLSDPNLWKNEKNFIIRKLWELNWISKEETVRMVKPTKEENQATLDLQLLNDNEDVWPILDMNEDHWTFITIYQRALNTPAKWKAIQRRLLAADMAEQNKAEQMAQQPQQQQWNPQAWSMWNMLVNDMIQNQNKTQNWAKSLDSIS